MCAEVHVHAQQGQQPLQPRQARRVTGPIKVINQFTYLDGAPHLVTSNHSCHDMINLTNTNVCMAQDKNWTCSIVSPILVQGCCCQHELQESYSVSTMVASR